jgi:DNA polymerase-1
VTATGRLSSSNPNLQNIPIRREKGRNIREAFKAQHKGNVLLAADYSQIELRILAHFSGDKNLVQCFKNDMDIHSVTASVLNGVPADEVTPQMRYQAKAVNFGIIYGQGPYGLARVAGISHSEARKFIDTYFEQFPGIKSFIDSTIDKAYKSGEVRTILNRRRKIPELNSSNKNTQQSGKRMAVNTVIQGSAADLIKKAMVDIHTHLKEQDAKALFILQIHDELVFELPETEIDMISEIVCNDMEHAIKLSVPLKVHIEYGKTWKETK